MHHAHRARDPRLAARDHPRILLLSRVLTETLRLYLSGWFLTRTTTHPTQLADAHLPTGTLTAGCDGQR
ncbi:cytochrome P450 [Embleya sp. MST-111070]|uniref:cytochrome P450 n=1 Tax=Embleya sp. MST-111070 TaxID=3398231 RepID=UPI003F734E32